MWGLWWTKRHWSRFSPSTSVSPVKHSTNFSIIIITRGWHNRPIGGRSVEWTQLDSTPTIPIKEKYMLLFQVVVIQECTSALHSRYLLVAASTLYSTVLSLPSSGVCLLYCLAIENSVKKHRTRRNRLIYE
jgi:hypothetical protein